MTGIMNMNNNKIENLPTPTGMNDPTTLGYIHSNYLGFHGQQKMGGNLNMNDKKIIHLSPPTTDTDASTKKYVDDNKVNVC